jgi:ATP-dependent Zn protease
MLTVSHPQFSYLKFSGKGEPKKTSEPTEKSKADKNTGPVMTWATSRPGFTRILLASTLAGWGGQHLHTTNLEKAAKTEFCARESQQFDYSQLARLERILTAPSEYQENTDGISTQIQNNVLEKQYIETSVPNLGKVWIFKTVGSEPRILQLDGLKETDVAGLKGQLRMQGFAKTVVKGVPKDPIPTLYCEESNAAKNADEIINLAERGLLQSRYLQTQLADGTNAYNFILQDGTNVQLPFTNIQKAEEHNRLQTALSSLKFKYHYERPEGSSALSQWGPTLLLIAAFFGMTAMARNMAPGSGSLPGVGKFKPVPVERPKVRMKQVAGNEVAKSYAQEVIQYLQDSKKTCDALYGLYERKRHLDSWKNKSKDFILGTESASKREEIQEKIDQLLSDWKEDFPRPRRGLLFEGPTRSGKTLLAKAIAGEAAVPFYYISGEEFSAMYHGQGGERVRKVFEEAIQHPQAILFIDEADKAATQRQEGIAGSTDASNEKTTAFLTSFDKYMADHPGLCVMMATNFKEQLDQALLQNGRMDTTVTVDYPGTHAEVIRVFDQLCENNNVVIADPEERKAIQAGVSELYRRRSPGDMELFIRTAKDIRNKEARKVSHPVPYQEKHFAQAWLDENVGPKNPGAGFTHDEQTRVAYHEYGRGHALEGFLVGWAPRAIVSGARGKAGGLVLPLADNPTMFDTLDSTLRNILISVAGQAAETDVYGETGTSQGARQDYDQAEMKLLEALYEHRYFPGRLTAPTYGVVSRVLERLESKDIPKADLVFFNDILNMAKETVTKHYRYMELYDSKNWMKLEEQNRKFSEGHVEMLGKEAREHFPNLFQAEDGTPFDKTPYEHITQGFIKDVVALSLARTSQQKQKVLEKYNFFKRAQNPFGQEGPDLRNLQERIGKGLQEHQKYTASENPTTKK